MVGEAIWWCHDDIQKDICIFAGQWNILGFVGWIEAIIRQRPSKNRVQKAGPLGILLFDGINWKGASWSFGSCKPYGKPWKRGNNTKI
jgi:hypothetical protein